MSIVFLKMAGPLSSGAERGRGSLIHAVETLDQEQLLKYGDNLAALCGRFPSIRWASGAHESVTCPRCASKLRRLRKAERTS